MHIPVLEKEVLEYLDARPNRNYIDCTFGLGGHSRAILEKSSPDGKVLGIEVDGELVGHFKSEIQNPKPSTRAKLGAGPVPHRNEVSGAGFETNLKFKIQNIETRLILANDSYRNLKNIAEAYNFKPVHGILFDLGMSTWHLAESGRGFSFLKDEPLLMNYESRITNHETGITAADIINTSRIEEIEKILKEYGEERFARQIAKKIVEERKKSSIRTTFQLIEVIRKSTPFWYHRRRIHFATKTFQALRLAVNDELESIRAALPQALESLVEGGRIAVISFHSLEDRIVKTLFLQWEKSGRGIRITKKPVRASQSEKKTNPASRSAKLRVFQKD